MTLVSAEQKPKQQLHEPMRGPARPLRSDTEYELDERIKVAASGRNGGQKRRSGLQDPARAIPTHKHPPWAMRAREMCPVSSLSRRAPPPAVTTSWSTRASRRLVHFARISLPLSAMDT